jgi:MFS family permease
MSSAQGSQLSPQTLQRARLVTIFLFFFNGIALSALTPRLADLQGQLAMSDLALGVVLSAGAAGGLFFGPFAAMGMRKFGSGQFSMIALVLMLPLLPLVGLAPSIFILGIVIFAIGAVDSVLDAAQNAHGLQVQRLYKRSIINNMHAFWALGTVTGALIGAITLALDFSLTWSLFFVSIIGLLGALATFRWLLPKSLTTANNQTELAEEIHADHLTAIDPGSVAPAGRITRFHISSMFTALTVIGLLTVLAVIVEDVPQRWSSVYLTDLGVDGARVGLGVVAFTIALTVGRFVGDRFVNRFGERLVAQVSMGITALALTAALVAGNFYAYIGACVVVGLGIATLFPAAMHAATFVKGTNPETAITVVSWISRAGFVFAPFMVGLIADRVGVTWGISIAVLAAVLLIPLSQVLRSKKITDFPYLNR